MTGSITESVGNGNNGNRGRHTEPPSPWWLVGAIVVVVALQVIWWLSLWFLVGWSSEDLAYIGELFGGVSALFTGLAFSGLLYTIFLQHSALQTQSKDLVETQEAQRQQVRLSIIATLVDVYMRQRDIMERGGFRTELWDADGEIIRWAREKADNELSYEKARAIGMEKLDRYIKEHPESVFNKDSKHRSEQFRISFEAWIKARRESEDLLLELERDYQHVDNPTPEE